MIWVAALVVVLLVFSIAAFAIGRETHRLDAVAPAPTFDLYEAIEWIADRLPPEISAQVTYEDVRDLVTWHLEDLQERGVEPGAGPDGSLVIVDDAARADAVALRAMQDGRDIAPEHIAAVLAGELAYLEAIGAIGPLADPPPSNP